MMVLPAFVGPAVASLVTAYSGVIVPPAEVHAAVECVSAMTGLPVPATLPVVIRSDRWTFSGEEVCCNERGETYQGARLINKTDSAGRKKKTTVISARMVATYHWPSRAIVLSASAGPEHLAHEIAVDLKRHAINATPLSATRNAIDTWAYSVEARYPFDAPKIKGCAT